MSRHLSVKTLRGVASILVILALVNHSLAIRSLARKFSCRRCTGICGLSSVKITNPQMKALCSRCSTICNADDMQRDPWLTISQKKKRKFNALDDGLDSEKAVPPPVGLLGRSIIDAVTPPPISATGINWWGRRR